MKVYKNYINGKWISSNSRKTFESLNPATKKPLGKFQLSNEKDVNEAVRSAEKAFQIWKDIPPPKKGEILFNVASILRKRKNELSKLVTQEMGKVLPEGKGDVQEAIDMTEYIAGEGRRLFGRTTTSELPDKFAMAVRAPVGVYGLITPWNFPFAIPSWKIIPAIMCGNTVVFKPSTDTPLCAVRFVQILEEAGLPKGVVNLVTGSGNVCGSSLIKHPDIHGISFTGSRNTGEYIRKNAGLKKIGLEMGGKNPIIIMEDADLKLALDGVIWGSFGTTGQRCTAASRVILHKDIRKDFEEMLVKRTKRLKLGPGLKSSTDVGPLINERALDKVHKYTQIGLKEKASLLTGGGFGPSKGFFYKPTIFTKVTPNMRIAQEEIFGPTVSLIKSNDLKEAVKIANNIEYGLSASIYTSDINKAFKAIDNIQAGIVYVNSSTIGSEVHLPFGGVKKTGSTREGGWTVIEEFSEWKTIYVDYSGKLQKAQIDVVKVD